FSTIDRIISSKAPEFPEDATWLNTKEPLSIQKLKGHIVIIDFWTYCCINCMHMIPTLSKIEEEYKNEPVVVIGVHSAKFENEQKPENIEEAIGRYEITHPVVVDKGMKIWKMYGANAWPTVVIIDAKGNIAYKKAGERTISEIGSMIEALLDKAKESDTLAKKKIEIDVPEHKNKNVLSYPGKLSFSEDQRNFAISDSNHNRILIVETSTGKVTSIIGSGERGFKDGNFGSAKFFRPQGVLWVANKLYVADTENHALREVDLKTEKVTTVAGTGEQGVYHPFEFSADGTKVQLSSPWDLAYYENKIIIAMAGLHQLWAYEPKSGFIFPFAGSGLENIFDGNLPDAQFAQPSGLYVDNDYLYVADSEVSGVRSIDLKKRFVSTLIGSGLFVFGHKDGGLGEAKLQHPLGVCAKEDKVYVADTYNSSIRVIDLKKDTVSTLIGTPSAKSACRFDDPNCDTLGLYEPSDVKISGKTLYIVDTNNHLVRYFDLDQMMLKTLNLKMK
ncbi:MAG: thioredoxin-like domain-containing protein, partial [Candidatus Micrarchaeales archaeon]